MNPEIDQQLGKRESLKRKVKDVLKGPDKENEAPVDPNIEQKQETEKMKKPQKIALDENQQEVEHKDAHTLEEHGEEDEETKKKGLFRSLMDFLKNHHPFHKVGTKVGNRIIHLPSLHGDDVSSILNHF